MGFYQRRSALLPLVKKIASSNGLDSKIIDGIIITESSYDRWAVRYEKDFRPDQEASLFSKLNMITRSTEVQIEKMSWGLAQIMGGTARWLGYRGPLTQLTDPEINLELMATLLKRLNKKYRSSDAVISAYNAGSARRRTDGSFKNQIYVDKVHKNMECI